MPRIGTGTKDRTCLVCGGKTSVAHMGLDVCRACTVFYRRSVGKRVYACRSNSNACTIGPEGVNCRKCRFDHIERVLEESGALSLNKASESDDSQEGPGPSCDDLAAIIGRDSRSFSGTDPSVSRPILTRLRNAYKTMSEIRFISELNLRPEPPHPMEMKNREDQFYPATFGAMQIANRVFLSAVIPFAGTAFHEFKNFSDEEQWKIILSFGFRFRPFESTYRADKAFPDRLDRSLGGYTTYVCSDNADLFYSDCPNITLVSLEDVKRLMLSLTKTAFVKNRTFIARLKPDLVEYLAIVGIMFWTLEDATISEEAHHLSEQYRSDILQELHGYYRDELQMTDYAARLGELLTLVHAFDKCDEFKEFFELLRLMNVLTDDTFSYQIIKDV